MIPREKLEALSVEVLTALNVAVVEVLKSKRRDKAYERAATLKVGDHIKYESRRQGCTVTGVITRMNRTRCEIKSDLDQKLWIVPMNLLIAEDTPKGVTPSKQRADIPEF